MSKRKHDVYSQDDPAISTEQPPIFTSTPIHDRSSTFTAVFTPSTTSPRSLQRHAPFESAMHKILAWRKPSAQRSIAGSLVGASSSTSQSQSLAKATTTTVPPPKVVFETGSDEDGEKYAGKKVEKVLTDMDVQGTVVVARWFGGVMLGPVRFKWIEDSAREAILKWKASLGEGDGATKKVKNDEGVGGGSTGLDEAKEKERLLKVLKDRDSSVDVLRGLLAEKNMELKKIEASGQNEAAAGGSSQTEAVKSPVATVLDYRPMPLQRLKQLEKARDATLSWILKQIDVVEERLKTAQKTKEES